MQGIFKRLWKLPLLPRIAQFLWKCVKDILQTRDKLVYVIQNGDYSWPLCSQTMETSSHSILYCNTSRAVWFAVLGIHIQPDVHIVEWFCSWFDKLLSHQVPQDVICKIAIVALCIWTSRCDIVFKGWKVAVDAIVHRCKLEIELHQKEPPSLIPQAIKQCRTNLHWSPLTVDTFKINVDGSFHYDLKNGGIGLIVRDFAGTHRGSKCIYLEAAFSPEQVDFKGLWEAMKWAKEMNLEKVDFELDSQIVADAVNKERLDIDWRIRNMLLDIKSIFANNSSWHCSYVPKEKNKVADALAKLARISYLSSVWLLSIPEQIQCQVQEDANFVHYSECSHFLLECRDL